MYGLTTTSIVQSVWNNGKSLHIHGLVYDPKTGILKDLQRSGEPTVGIDDVYRLEPVYA